MNFRAGEKLSILIKDTYGRPDLDVGKIYSGTVRINEQDQIFIQVEGKVPTIIRTRGTLLIPNNAVNKMLYPELKEYNEEWLSYES
jgi:hypothetical protein